MAYYAQTNTSSASFPERAFAAGAGLLQAAAEHCGRYRVYRQTYNELAALSEHDLNDLGLSRSMIRGIAQEAAAAEYAGN